MRIIAKFIFFCIIFSSLATIALSVWPGILNDLLLAATILSIICLPFALVVFILLVIILYKEITVFNNLTTVKRWICLYFTVIAISTSTIIVNVPMRIAFIISRNNFEESAQIIPKSTRGVRANMQLGIYWVDEFAADPRGGKYFRVYSGSDGIGPDTMSYGFVKQPNTAGTPFGKAHYETFHIIDDWFYFKSSNDY